MNQKPTDNKIFCLFILSLLSLHDISETAKWRGAQGVLIRIRPSSEPTGFLVVTLFDKRSVTDTNPVGFEDEYGSPDFAQVANVSPLS